MERDNFTCTKCGSKGELQVHHVTPLRQLIKEVKNKHNIIIFSDHTIDDLMPLVNEVVEAHTLDMGITVCKSCHAKIDELYFH